MKISGKSSQLVNKIHKAQFTQVCFQKRDTQHT